MNTFTRVLVRLWKADPFSAEAFVARAGLLALLYGVSELLGLREYTTFLSGTSANLNVSWQTAAILGLIHLLLYVGFILLVPVFLIAAGLLTAYGRLSSQRQSLQPPSPPESNHALNTAEQNAAPTAGRIPS